MSATRRGIVRCGAAAVLFGATTPFASRVADDASAPVIAGLLYLGAALAVAPAVTNLADRIPLGVRRRSHRGSSGDRRFHPDALRRSALRLGVAVVAGGLLGPLLLVAGLARTPAATASLLLNLELVATAVLASLFFGEHLGRRVLAGTSLVVTAGLVLAWSGTPSLRVGAFLIVAACACWGLDNCVTAAIDEIPAEHVTLVKGVVAGGTNLALGFALGGQLPPGGAAVGALAIGAIGYGASITLWVSGARNLGAARGQLVFSAAPFVGVAVAWLLFRDPVRAAEILALLLAVVGVASVQGSQHEHAHTHNWLQHDHEHTHDEDHHDHDHANLGQLLLASGRHTHRHDHEPMAHGHPHVPDLHHRHEHGDA